MAVAIKGIGILGKKMGMTEVYRGAELVPVSVIKAGPCKVIGKRTPEKDGYSALILGFEPVPLKKLNKPMRGFFERRGLDSGYRYIKELRVPEEELSKYSIGDEIKVDLFEKGELVKVTGISKGHGFSGAIKRWGMSRGPMSHGSKHHRRPGSNAVARIGPTKKGKRRPGHYGVVRTTVLNLEVVDVIPEENLILVKGSIPGWKNSLVTVTKMIG